ncbi:MAG: class I SAM-dependent methyltransferase [Chloroflexi bacterium]|nr:class I SAM-dependent methyltransferase [Chloroflexota bacterium]
MNNKSKAYFDNITTQWDTMRTGFFPEAVRDHALKLANIKAGDVVADVGAGSGFLTEAILNAGASVIAIDQSSAMLDVMRAKFPDMPVTYCIGTAENLQLDDASVDHALANMYLHHVENPPQAIAEMVRIIKPGGSLVITDLNTHNFEFLRKEQHDRWLGFDRADVQAWFETAGLADVRVEDVGSNCCADSECGTQQADVSIFVAYGRKP